MPREFPCAKCGAKLTFEPGTQTLKCAHCGFENTPPQSRERVEELDYRAYLDKLAGESIQHESLAVHCTACGAQTALAEDTVAGKCPFCGSAIVAESQSHRRIKPAALLPFAVTRDQGVASFREWIGSLWFAPGGLKRLAQADQGITGIYIPYWTYDADTSSEYTGQRGDDYTVTVGSGKDAHTETRTEWSSVAGQVDKRFVNVLVLASQTLPARFTEELEPWDLPYLTDYSDDYLSGFVAQCYQVGLPEGFTAAQGKMAPRIQEAIRADIGGDHQRIEGVSTSYDNITFKHILLPVWLSAYRYQDKVYRFLINGRTGEVQGERPYSAVKIAAAVIAGLAVAGVIVMAILARMGR